MVLNTQSQQQGAPAPRPAGVLDDGYTDVLGIPILTEKEARDQGYRPLTLPIPRTEHWEPVIESVAASLRRPTQVDFWTTEPTRACVVLGHNTRGYATVEFFRHNDQWKSPDYDYGYKSPVRRHWLERGSE